jgi:UDP-N-acetyl-D-glucosamine dehydrogenase
MSTSPALDTLLERLRGPRPTVAVVGLGYVGLPLCAELAEAGAEVLGIDVSRELCARLNDGVSHVGDVSDARLRGAREHGFSAGVDFSVVARADAIVICVPTPLRKTKDPDISYIVAAGQSIAPHARAGQLLVLESTTYPGTTEEILVPMLRERGLEPGVDVCVAFSPERVDPGNPKFGIRNTPKVVGGLTPVCSEAAAALYARCCDHVYPVRGPATAEMVKLLENTFRMVNIGLVNEFALICRQLGVDVWEVIDAAATKPFGFMPFKPGPGLGGHCIPVDPHYLAWKLRAHNFTARFVELADAINSAMPEHVVDVVAEVLNDHERAVKKSRILALGVAYKPNVADVRESPAIEVLNLLLHRGADVAYHDPYIASVEVEGRAFASVPSYEQAVRDADLVVVLTDHKDYDWDVVVRDAKLVVDARNATAKARAKSAELAGKVRAI